MIINFNDKQNQSLDINVSDDSYRYRAIKGEHALTLHFSASHHVEIPVGASVEFEGERYGLEQPGNFKKNSTRNFEYTLVMEAAQAKLNKYKLRNIVDKRLVFNLTARPHEHLQMIVDNMNLRESGWRVGDCIDAVEKNISYNHAFCIDALGQIAEEFQTEYEIDGKTIHLRKVEYNKDNPLPLSYGKGNGFRPGVGRSNYSDSKPIEVLFVQGGEDNIDPSKYGGKELLLPRNATVKYDGEHFEDEAGFNNAIARTYTTDAEGLSLRRADKDLQTREEDSLDCSHIYPKRVGIISAVEVVNADKNFYDIIDNKIPDDLNFDDCIISGETMTIIPQSGMLAGKEFEATYIHDAKSGKAGRRFEIKPQDIDGQTMPNATFNFAVGNTYAVYHIAMPSAYVCSNATKSGASWDMFREAVKYLYDNEEQKFSFTGELDGIWAKKDWLNIGGRIRLGGYILFSDAQFQPDGVVIRIVGIKDYINNPHSPEIELSNQTVGNSFTSQLNKIEKTEVVVDDQYRKALQFTKRRFQDSLETIEMLGNAMLDNFTNNINPLAVQTMAVLIGDESLQFQFVNNKTKPEEVPHNVSYDTTSRVLTSPAGIIQHMTMGIDTISSGHAASEYRFWDMPTFTTPALDDDKRYFLYAKVNDVGSSGVFHISEEGIGMKSVAGYYHLLMGVLNSAYNGSRSFVPLYGYSEVLPGQLLTKKIVSANGQNFIDFLNNAFRIGNSGTYIDWNASIANVLSMKNATIQMANASGQTMIYMSGVDGSGQLAKGNITWDTYGNIKAKGGTFTNVKIEGSLRNPFSTPGDSFDTDYSDNVVLMSSGGGWINAFSIPWDLSQSGRRITLVNYRWGSTISQGWAAISAPTGKYFYEDGIQKKELSMSREVIELMGYGDKSTFFGWLVLRRTNIMTASKYGRSLNVLAQGIVTGHSSGASINYKAFDEGTLTVSRLGEGQYKVYFPSSWGLTAGNYIVMMTGYGGGLMKASLLEPSTSYFVVEVSDDASRNDGSFMFQIINLNDWA